MLNFLNLFKPSLMMFAPGDEEGFVSFGSNKVSTEGMSAEQITNLKAANVSYVNSGKEALAQKTLAESHAAEVIKLKETKVDITVPKSMQEMIDASLAKKLEGITGVMNTARDNNQRYEISNVKAKISQDYAGLPKEKLDKILSDTDEFFKGLEPSARTGALFENFAKVKLADTMRENVASLEVGKAKELLLSNPELKAEIMKSLIAEYNIDIDMPSGMGIANEAEYQTRFTKLQGEFRMHNTTPQRKTAIAQQLSDLQKEGKKFGYKVS